MNDCGETGRFRLQLVVEDKQDIDSEVGKEKIKFLFERLRFFYKVIKIIESAGEISEVDKQNIQQEIIRSLHDIKSSFGHFVSNIFVESDFLEVKSNFEELLSDYFSLEIRIWYKVDVSERCARRGVHQNIHFFHRIHVP